MKHRPNRTLASVIPFAILLVALAACGGQRNQPPEQSTSTTTLNPTQITLDPCKAMSPDQLTRLDLEVRKPNWYVAGPFNDSQLQFNGCLMKYAPDKFAEFYLEATNMTAKYMTGVVGQDSNTSQTKVDSRDTTVAHSKDDPGQCRVLIEMGSYRLLLDGNFPNQSCDRAIELAGQIAPILPER